MKEAYYFSHDSNARHDPNIIPMRGVYGAEGYGWYWILIEMMRDANGYRLDMQGKYIWNAYAQQMGCIDIECAKQFILDCIEEFKLFATDGEFFWSNSLIRRMEKREKVNEKRREAANVRWGNKADVEPKTPDENADGMQMHSTSNADAMQGKERKVKERKVKGNKEDPKDITPDGEQPTKCHYAPFVSLTEKEHQQLVELLGDELEDYFMRFGSWLSGQTTRVQNSRSAYLTIRNWHREDQKKRGVKHAVTGRSSQNHNAGVNFGF